VVERMWCSLESIGFEEVAKESRLLPPRVSISLPQLARQTGYELLFFPALQGQLTEALDLRVRGVRLEGLRDCAKLLVAKKRWESQCRELSEQIIGFSRSVIMKSPEPPVELLIC